MTPLPDPFKYLSVALAVALVALAAAFAVTLQAHKVQVSVLEGKVKTLASAKAELVVELAEQKAVATKALDANKMLTTAIEAQNAQVAKLLAEADSRKAASAAALARANAESLKWKSKFDEIMSGPKPDPDDLKAITILLDKYYLSLETP